MYVSFNWKLKCGFRQLFLKIPKMVEEKTQKFTENYKFGCQNSQLKGENY